MAQGKAWNKEKVLKVLEPYLKLGYTRRKSCIHAGLDPSVLSVWEKDEPELSLKIDSWISEVNAVARINVVNKIKDGDVDKSTWWLERKESKEFSTRSEQHNTHEGELNLLRIVHEDANRDDNEPVEGQELAAPKPVQDQEQAQADGADDVQPGTTGVPYKTDV